MSFMAVLRLFASAREAAGVGRTDLPGRTVGAVLREARARFGEEFARVLLGSRVWVNGMPADEDTSLTDTDEVAVLPPVSGGCEGPGRRSGLLGLPEDLVDLADLV